MDTIIYEHSLISFLIFTCILGGLAAFQTGRAIAQSWQPMWFLMPYALLLAATTRFLYYAILGQTLLSAHYLFVDFCVLLIACAFGWRIKRRAQMITQYSWAYEQTGVLSWRKKRKKNEALKIYKFFIKL